MDSAPSFETGSQAHQRITLDAKIRDVISSIRRNESLKQTFVDSVWPRLESDYSLMVQDLIALCNNYLGSRAIPGQVIGRAKSSDSVGKSLDRREKHRKGRGGNGYKEFQEIFDDLHELAGIRIIIDYPTHLARANDFIEETFQKRAERTTFSRDRLIGRSWKAWFGAYQT